MENQLPKFIVTVAQAQEEGKTRLSLSCSHKGENQSVAMYDQKPLHELVLKDVLRMLRCACEFLEAQCMNKSI